MSGGLGRASPDGRRGLRMCCWALGLQPQELTCCTWIRVPEDALVAVGGSDGVVRVVSVARSAVLRHLTGHKGEGREAGRGRGERRDWGGAGAGLGQGKGWGWAEQGGERGGAGCGWGARSGPDRRAHKAFSRRHCGRVCQQRGRRGVLHRPRRRRAALERRERRVRPAHRHPRNRWRTCPTLDLPPEGPGSKG